MVLRKSKNSRIDSLIPLCYDVPILMGMRVMNRNHDAMIQNTSLQATVNSGRVVVLAHHHHTT